MVLVLSGMWTVFCFCLSLEPDQEGLDSDAAETRATSVKEGVLIKGGGGLVEIRLRKNV